MARPSRGMRKIQLFVREETLTAIAESGPQSEWIREAIDEKLEREKAIEAATHSPSNAVAH